MMRVRRLAVAGALAGTVVVYGVALVQPDLQDPPMDIAIKRPGDPTDVHLQCFGPNDGSIHITNAILSATLPGSLTLR
jgi:hypothetical protein